MASDRLSTNLSYLTDAAHLLRATAPEVSAHLMRQRAMVMFHSNLAQHEVQRQYVCGACGNIMVPGDGTSLKLDSRKLQRRQIRRKGGRLCKEQDNHATAGSTKSITCGLCSCVTKTILAPAPPPARRKTTRVPAAKKTQADELQNKKPTANASSKKRAKTRKGGLQALLSGQQQKPSNSLSLADFMQ